MNYCEHLAYQIMTKSDERRRKESQNLIKYDFYIPIFKNLSDLRWRAVSYRTRIGQEMWTVSYKFIFCSAVSVKNSSTKFHESKTVYSLTLRHSQAEDRWTCLFIKLSFFSTSHRKPKSCCFSARDRVSSSNANTL